MSYAYITSFFVTRKRQKLHKLNENSSYLRIDFLYLLNNSMNSNEIFKDKVKSHKEPAFQPLSRNCVFWGKKTIREELILVTLPPIHQHF